MFALIDEESLRRKHFSIKYFVLEYNVVYLLHNFTFILFMTEKADIIFSYSNSEDAILESLGIQLKQMRLNKNLTQKQLSEQTGLSRSAISDLENKGTGSMNSFIRVLRALEKLEILNYFISETPVSPIQIAKMKGKTRKRASGKNKTKNNNEGTEW